MRRNRHPFFTLSTFLCVGTLALAATVPLAACAAATSPGELRQYAALDHTERIIAPLAELGLRARTDPDIAVFLNVPPLTPAGPSTSGAA
jgi:hypothetical protein